MADIFDKWNKEIDGEALKADTKEAEENGKQYEEVPYGTYEVKIEKIEIKECGSDRHKGEPMLSVWFKIIAGKRAGALIFMNQLITQGFQIHIANEFLKSLDTGVDVEFDGNFRHYNNMILDVFEGTQELEYALEYAENKKGFSTYKITDVYDAK